MRVSGHADPLAGMSTTEARVGTGVNGAAVGARVMSCAGAGVAVSNCLVASVSELIAGATRISFATLVLTTIWGDCVAGSNGNPVALVALLADEASGANVVSALGVRATAIGLGV